MRGRRGRSPSPTAGARAANGSTAEDVLLDSQEELRALIAASPVPIIAYDPDGVITLWNQAAERVFGWSAAEAVGRFAPIMAGDMVEEFREIRERVFRGGSFSGFETVRLRKDGTRIEVQFWNAPVRDRHGNVRSAVSLVEDVTERRRGERRQNAQHAVARIIAESESLADASPRILEALGRGLGGEAASWLREGESSTLECGAFWRSGPELEAFEAATRGDRRTRGEGLPGKVWEAGKPVWLEELRQDARPARFAAAREGGLVTGFGFPIVHAGEVLGVIEVFTRQRSAVDPVLMNILEATGTQIGQFVARTRVSREREELVAALTASDERYRSLVDAIAEIVWVTGPDGGGGERSPAWLTYTGQTPEEAAGDGWLDVLHPDDRERARAAWELAVATEHAFESEYRLCGTDGRYRHFVSRGVPVRGPDGTVHEWIGVCIDVGLRKRREEALRFLAEASAVLAGSLDYTTTLRRLTRLAVPAFADICMLDIVQEDGEIERIIESTDPQMAALAEPLRRFTPRPHWNTPQARVLRTGEPILLPDVTDELVREISHDDEHFGLLRRIGLRSTMVMPLQARGRTLGGITFSCSKSGRRYDEDDLLLGEEIARRTALALDNARLYQEAEERGQAARVLAAIGDGVVLVDTSGVVRLWNRGAEAITGLDARDVVGSNLADVLPSWAVVQPRTPTAEASTGARAETLPIEVDGRELWLSISGVGFSEGTVYAFRDLTEERAIEEMKSEIVATVSHELRTPLAAVYGAAITLQREDLELEEETRSSLLRVIGDQAERLAGIVNDILLASRLDTPDLMLGRERFAPEALASGVVAAARTHAPESIEIELVPHDGLPSVAADADRVRQVLANLVDNGVKYSPNGGKVLVALAADNGFLRFSVSDTGIGVPAAEQERIFERFYRLDPNLTSGVGGTGLGLYICRELVRRMGGRIWVESREGEGSTFSFELPIE
jgi:PAS domain S-box-containing protein